MVEGRQRKARWHRYPVSKKSISQRHAALILGIPQHNTGQSDNMLVEGSPTPASGFILAHNHPSGDPTPSAHDRELTQVVKAAAVAIGIRFLDHLIIGDAAPFSFKANGLI